MGESELKPELGQRGDGLISGQRGYLCRPTGPKEDNVKMQVCLDQVQEKDGPDYSFRPKIKISTRQNGKFSQREKPVDSFYEPQPNATKKFPREALDINSFFVACIFKHHRQKILNNEN